MNEETNDLNILRNIKRALIEILNYIQLNINQKKQNAEFDLLDEQGNPVPVVPEEEFFADGNERCSKKWN